MIEDCTALILAGGDSRRMGRDKASMVLEGKSLLEHVTATMQSLFPKVIVSVRRFREDIDTQQVCDHHDASGPLAGLVAGLSQIDTPWTFAVACDMPFVSKAVIMHLASMRVGYQAVVPIVQEHVQPVAAFYATNTLIEMRNSLAAGDMSLRGVLEKIKVKYISEVELRATDPQLRSFFDLDTPQDFEQAVNMKVAK